MCPSPQFQFAVKTRNTRRTRREKRPSGQPALKSYWTASTLNTELCINIPAKFWESLSKCSAAHPNMALWRNVSASHARNLAGFTLPNEYYWNHMPVYPCNLLPHSNCARVLLRLARMETTEAVSTPGQFSRRRMRRLSRSEMRSQQRESIGDPDRSKCWMKKACPFFRHLWNARFLRKCTCTSIFCSILSPWLHMTPYFKIALLTCNLEQFSIRSVRNISISSRSTSVHDRPRNKTT